MQSWPLTTTHVLQHAARWHAEQEVVSHTCEGTVVVSTYADLARRAALAAVALRSHFGVREGSVVATLATNTARHLESWYAVMGLGGVLHTLNPRLSDGDIAYIATHAGDQVILADAPFLPILGRIFTQLPQLQAVVVLTDRQHMPDASSLPPGFAQLLHCYEALLDRAVGQLPGFSWPELDEHMPAGLCYTSGTTGRPKGVQYTHRSNLLHAFVTIMPDALSLSATSCVLMVVPMFHANSWGLAFTAPMVGAKLVLPGPHLDGASLFHLIETYRVDVTAGVPTVVLGLLQHMQAHKLTHMHGMKRIIIGGAAAPRSMLAAVESLGIDARHMWGMTEISPLGTLGTPSGQHLADGPLSREQSLDIKVKQGRPHLLCDMRIVDEAGRELPRDGRSVGNLQVRGPIVVQQYHRSEGATVDASRWFDTGDVASIDRQGVMHIQDRSKDVVKSGGEWISSIALENTAMGHPKVAEAAVIAIPCDKYGERPLLIVVPAAGAAGDPEGLRREVLAFMAASPEVAKFAVPDDCLVVPDIPHTATGKISKLTLRQMFGGHRPRASRL